jgi:hypothetical protein
VAVDHRTAIVRDLIALVSSRVAGVMGESGDVQATDANDWRVSVYLSVPGAAPRRTRALSPVAEQWEPAEVWLPVDEAAVRPESAQLDAGTEQQFGRDP